MINLLFDILSKHYMWPWIQEFAVGLARLSKRAYEVFKDNMHAEARVVDENLETQYLLDLWSEDEGYRCEGCDDSDCGWCTSWGRHLTQAQSTPQWSEGESDNS